MEFIKDICVTIDEVYYEDPKGLMKTLQPYYPEKNGSCYKVRGTYEELENLSYKLSAMKHHVKSEKMSQQYGPTPVRSVEVSDFVMSYIQQKCAEELYKIKGLSFVVETQPDLRTVRNNSSSTVQVIIRPIGDCAQSAHADYVRERFITLYQRTAADLQVTHITLSPHDHTDLQDRFPRLLFEASHKNQFKVTGPFLQIAKLEEFLLQNTPSLSKSAANEGSADTLSKDPNESCPICMEPIQTKKSLECKHSFCEDCLKQAFSYKPVCPICGVVQGTLIGTQPAGGKMTVSTQRASLPGYESYGTIIINYDIPSGIQKKEHPNPGQHYEGALRTAYLPDSSEGRRILKLLKRAFDQRLVFTVGRSTTTGRDNTVTWNDIHHKTSIYGGATQYGYPDPDYLTRVEDELKVKGIK